MDRGTFRDLVCYLGGGTAAFAGLFTGDVEVAILGMGLVGLPSVMPRPARRALPSDPYEHLAVEDREWVARMHEMAGLPMPGPPNPGRGVVRGAKQQTPDMLAAQAVERAEQRLAPLRHKADSLDDARAWLRGVVDSMDDVASTIEIDGQHATLSATTADYMRALMREGDAVRNVIETLDKQVRRAHLVPPTILGCDRCDTLYPDTVTHACECPTCGDDHADCFPYT